MPPSLLATALLLQTHDKARADFDIRWKVALGIEIEDRSFAKSTLQVFRAQLILHDKVREVFEQSLRLARERGYLKGKRGMRVAMDTTYILGRGAVNAALGREPMWSCPNCGVIHDRNENAARNLGKLALLAVGEDVMLLDGGALAGGDAIAGETAPDEGRTKPVATSYGQLRLAL